MDNDFENGHFNIISDDNFGLRNMNDSVSFYLNFYAKFKSLMFSKWIFLLKFINRPAREENYLNNNNDDNLIECQCHPILHHNSDQQYENRVKV